MIPVAARDPGARRTRGRVGLEATDEFARALGVAQLDRRQGEAAVNEVHVRVDEARHDHHPARIDRRARTGCALPNLGARTHRGEALAVELQRISPWPALVARPDASV